MSALPGGKGSLQGHPLLLKLQKWKKICFILASVGFKVYISYSPLLSSSAPSVLPFKNLSQESLPSLAPYRKLLSAVIPLGPSQLEGGVPQGMLDNNNKDARLQDSKECPVQATRKSATALIWAQLPSRLRCWLRVLVSPARPSSELPSPQVPAFRAFSRPSLPVFLGCHLL